MSNKTQNLKLNIEYSDNETFDDVLEGNDFNYNKIDITFPSLLNALDKANEIFEESIDLEEGRLPRDYQEIEYLEHISLEETDYGYIVLDTIPTLNSVVKIKFKPSKGNIRRSAKFVFRNSNNDDNSLNLYSTHHDWLYSSWCDLQWYFSGSYEWRNFFQIQYESIVELELSNGIVKRNGTIIKTYEEATSMTQDTLKLFGYNTGISPFYANQFDGRIYYFKLYDGNNLVLDLVPCYKKIDNKQGMYDMISGTFYEGTGKFNNGPDVK